MCLFDRTEDRIELGQEISMQLRHEITTLRAGTRLGFMREMRDSSGEAARAWGEVGGALSSPSPAHLAPRSRGFATCV